MAHRAGQRHERHNHGTRADGNLQIIAEDERKHREHQDPAAAAGKAAHPADAAAEQHRKDRLAAGLLRGGRRVGAAGDGLHQKLHAEKHRREHGDIAQTVRRVPAEEKAAVAAGDRSKKGGDRHQSAAPKVDILVFIVCIGREHARQHVGGQRNRHGVIALPATETHEHRRDDHRRGQPRKPRHNAGAQTGRGINQICQNLHAIT